MNISKNSVLNGFLYEITEDDIILNLESYSIDNPSFFLYILNHNNSSFDSQFKDFIISNNLNEDIIYLNGWNKLTTKFATSFKANMFVDSLKDFPIVALKQSNIYFFENGKVVSALYDEKNNINIEDVKKYIESFGEHNND